MSLIKLNTLIYTRYTNSLNLPSIYHTFRVGNLVTYKDTDGKIHCDIVLDSFGDDEVRILTDGVVNYKQLRHADLLELTKYGAPEPLIIHYPEGYKDKPEAKELLKQTTEETKIMSCIDARELISQPNTILKSVELVENNYSLVKIKIYK
jgi:hypothetical protein